MLWLWSTQFLACLGSFALTTVSSSTYSRNSRLLSIEEAQSVYHSCIVAVKHLNEDKLYAELMMVSDPASDKYGRHWTREQVDDFVANPTGTAAVLRELEAAGLAVVDQSLRGMYIRANGSVAAWSSLLSVEFRSYNLKGKNNVIYRVENTQSILLPPLLSEHVSCVLNAALLEPVLHNDQTQRRLLSHIPEVVEDIDFFPDQKAAAGDTPCASPEILPSSKRQLKPKIAKKVYKNAISPYIVQLLYNISDSAGDPNIRQGVLASSDEFYSMQDFGAYRSEMQLPVMTNGELTAKGVSTSHDKVDRCSNTPSYCAETSLDVQALSSVVTGPKTVIWFDSEEDLLASWIYSVASDSSPPSVLSLSYGYSENAIIAAGDYGAKLVNQFDLEAKKLGLMGTTIIAASGDHGAIGRNNAVNGRCSYDVTWPASSPFVLSVGATAGPEAGFHGDLRERVCQANPYPTNPTNRSDTTSGGGFSMIYERPLWQSVAVAQYLYSSGPSADSSDMRNTKFAGRGVPDLAAVGNQFLTRIGQQWYVMSGTSVSAPIVAGMVSLINSQRYRAKNGTLGWLNPTLYAVAQTYAYTEFFNDITEGQSNSYLVWNMWSPTYKQCSGMGWAAATGWDPATGLGSLKFYALSAYLMTLSPSNLGDNVPAARAASRGLLANTQLAIILCFLLGSSLCGVVWGLYRRKFAGVCPANPLAVTTMAVLPRVQNPADAAAHSEVQVSDQVAHATLYRAAPMDEAGFDHLPVAAAIVVKKQEVIQAQIEMVPQRR